MTDAAVCHTPAAPRPIAGACAVALVGSPNSGKSTLFNALTGAGRAVGNYPGTSVEIGTGRWTAPEVGEVALTDLPGAYSLDPMSPDEELTADLLRGDTQVDAAVIVCDAAHLARSLVLASHVRLLPIRAVVALTMTDVAARRGVTIDAEQLSQRLGVPVVSVDPRRRDPGPLAAAVGDSLAGPPPRPLALSTTGPGRCCPTCPPDCTSCGVFVPKSIFRSAGTAASLIEKPLRTGTPVALDTCSLI